MTASSNRDWPPGVSDAKWSEVPTRVQEAIHQAAKLRLWPIFLCGQVGTGKTYAAACAYMRWQGNPVRWYRATDIVGDVLKCRTSASQAIVRTKNDRSWEETEEKIYEKIESASFVAFDDLGIREPTQAGFEVLFRMIESRKDKPTIYTSNLRPEQLRDVYDDRIVSRLCAGMRISRDGPDRRLAKGVTACL